MVELRGEMFWKRKKPAPGTAALDEGELFEAIDALTTANRAERSNERELELRRIRHLAGISLMADPPTDPRFPEPSTEVPELGSQSRVPEVSPDELTAPTLRAAILANGCLLVRGLMDRSKAEGLATDIDRAFEIRERLVEGERDPEGFYDELEPEPGYEIDDRWWVKEGGGVLAVDSPRMMFAMLESFEDAGLRHVIEEYLGERPAISSEKCTLRKATPDVNGAWHQDGAFLGDVRALNVWLSLSRCGDVAPSMDIVPRRLDGIVPTGTEGAWLESEVSPLMAKEAAGDAGIVRPIFEPGDALIFDDVFLHQTGSDASMPNPRYAIESWFFGPSAYPEGYVPIAF